MSQLDPVTKDNLMPNVVGKSVSSAKADIRAHATHDVTFSQDGGTDSSIVQSSTPGEGQTITDQVTLVVYNPAR